MLGNRKDPLADVVKKVMDLNENERRIIAEFNSELGIKDRRQLPHEKRAAYDQALAERLNEELKGDQHKIDANKNKRIDSGDFKILRSMKGEDKYKGDAVPFEASEKKGKLQEADKKKKTVMVVLKEPKTEKGKAAKKGGGGVFRLPQHLYDPKKHDLVSEEQVDEAAKWRSVKKAQMKNPRWDPDDDNEYPAPKYISKGDKEIPYEQDLSKRGKSSLYKKGPKTGKVTPASSDLLKSMIKTSLGKHTAPKHLPEEEQIDEIKDEMHPSNNPDAKTKWSAHKVGNKIEVRKAIDADSHEYYTPHKNGLKWGIRHYGYNPSDVTKDAKGAHAPPDAVKSLLKKHMNEEQIDEVSTEKLVAYKNKAGEGREKGSKLAYAKLTGKAKVKASMPKTPYMEEDIQQSGKEKPPVSTIDRMKDPNPPEKYTPKFGAENPNTGTKASAEDKAALQKKIEDIKEATYSAKAARAGKDIGKPGKMFSKIAKKAGEKYGSEERGKKVAGAVLAKIRAKHMKEEEQIDEVSKGLAKKYAKSAVNDLADRTDPNYGYITDKPIDDVERGAENRRKGIQRAIKILSKEEEQLDEVSLKKMVSAYKERAQMNRYPEVSFGDDDDADKHIEHSAKMQDLAKSSIEKRYGKKGVEAAEKAASHKKKYHKVGAVADPVAYSPKWTAKIMKGGSRKGKLSPKDQESYKSVHQIKLAKIKSIPKPYLPEEEQLDEKAVSKAQHRFMGLVYAIKKGKAHGSPKAEKAAGEMSTKEVRKFAKTKEKGLPEKVDESFLESIQEEIRANLLEKAHWLKENGTQEQVVEFLNNLTMEQREILNLAEADGPDDAFSAAAARTQKSIIGRGQRSGYAAKAGIGPQEPGSAGAAAQEKRAENIATAGEVASAAIPAAGAAKL